MRSNAVIVALQRTRLDAPPVAGTCVVSVLVLHNAHGACAPGALSVCTNTRAPFHSLVAAPSATNASPTCIAVGPRRQQRPVQPNGRRLHILIDAAFLLLLINVERDLIQA